MSTVTIFFGLYQGEFGDLDDDAILIAVFSSDEKALEFGKRLSDQHTELKRIANEARAHGMTPEDIPDFFWDTRPVAFDPRETGELL